MEKVGVQAQACRLKSVGLGEVARVEVESGSAVHGVRDDLSQTMTLIAVADMLIGLHVSINQLNTEHTECANKK